MIKNEKGFAVVEVTLLTMILIVLMALTYFVVQQNNKQTVSNSQTQTQAPNGVESITNKGLEEELKIEDQQSAKEVSSATEEVNSATDLEGAYEAGF
ncbi:MAG: hypothetical protein AAB914_04640 [Patescibacteria group bacterium]